MIKFQDVDPEFNKELRDSINAKAYKELYEYKINKANGTEDLLAVLETISQQVDPRIAIHSTENWILITGRHTWLDIEIVIVWIKHEYNREFIGEEIIWILCRSVLRLEYAETFIYYTQPHG